MHLNKTNVEFIDCIYRHKSASNAATVDRIDIYNHH